MAARSVARRARPARMEGGPHGEPTRPRPIHPHEWRLTTPQHSPGIDRRATARILRAVATDLDGIRVGLADAIRSDSPAAILVAAEIARAQLVYRILGLRDTIDQLERETPQ